MAMSWATTREPKALCKPVVRRAGEVTAVIEPRMDGDTHGVIGERLEREEMEPQNTQSPQNAAVQSRTRMMRRFRCGHAPTAGPVRRSRGAVGHCGAFRAARWRWQRQGRAGSPAARR